MTTSEIVAGQGWIVQTLRANAGLMAAIPGGVHTHELPQGEIFPQILVAHYRPSQDLSGVGPIRIKSDLYLLVKLVAQSMDLETWDPQVALIDSLIGYKRGIYSDRSIFACVRIIPIGYVESNEDAESYVHSGGVYWLQVN